VSDAASGPPILLSVDECAARLSISARLVKQLIRRSELQSVKLGARRLVHIADLHEFAERLRAEQSSREERQELER
jgi:excisionase family DNA binding protein